ncbi:hypothetical protein R1Y80_30410 [Streptomyces sp. JL1001]|uniref:PH domain-containing protein n=1 Tax=Streptomyces sp. JL1001 TaxID=3078227 RepID=A0AAU8KRP8_9ACTN
MATGAGLWEAGLGAWYGPGTPLVQRVRDYRPNRRGHIKLARWARIGCLRVAAVLLVALALAVTMDPPAGADVTERGLVGAVVLVMASFVWRCSLVRVVLRPGEIVHHSLWRRTVVPCSAVRRFVRPEGRSPLALETHAGEEVHFWLLGGSLWDLFYDFSSVCADAMGAHVRAARSKPPRARSARSGSPRSRKTSSRYAPVERRYTWSFGADTMALGAVVCVVAGLIG